MEGLEKGGGQRGVGVSLGVGEVGTCTAHSFLGNI